MSLALEKVSGRTAAVKDIDKKHFEACNIGEKKTRKLEDEVITLQKFFGKVIPLTYFSG